MTEGLTLGFPDGTRGKEPAGQAGDIEAWIPSLL